MICNKEIVALIKTYLLVYFLLFIYIALQAQQPTDTLEKNLPVNLCQKQITYHIFEAPSKTYCYDIYAYGKLLIHQPCIPGMPGKRGFVRKKDAEQVAELVVKKIGNAEMPPTITLKDMDSLKVKY